MPGTIKIAIYEDPAPLTSIINRVPCWLPKLSRQANIHAAGAAATNTFRIP